MSPQTQAKTTKFGMRSCSFSAMSTRELRFWYWIVNRLPSKLVYFCSLLEKQKARNAS